MPSQVRGLSPPARLNLGCGLDIRAGYVNLDSSPLPGVDVVHDVEELPLPFEDESFSEILCKDILEHTDYVPILKDLNRVLRPNGRLIVQAPHFTSRNVYLDPLLRFPLRSCRETKNHVREGSVSVLELCRRAGRERKRQLQRLYEETFLARLFPALGIEVVLIK